MAPPNELGVSAPSPSRLLVPVLMATLLIILTVHPRGVLSSPPMDLTNFQNEYPCDVNATLVVRWVKAGHRPQTYIVPSNWPLRIAICRALRRRA
jgi:hypothetical protein